MTKAVVDVGSNSVLLTVMSQTPDGHWYPVHESTQVTALGLGTKQTGLIREDTAAETLAALKKAFQTANAYGATSTTAAATMALRIATNAPEFLERAQAQQTPVTIITGDQEAVLGFQSVARDPAFADNPRLTIVDPGGHSTELLTARQKPHQPGEWEILFRRSYPVGALGLRENHLPDPSPSFAQRLAAVQEIDNLIGLEYLPNQCGAVVALGATGTNLVSIREKLTSWRPELVHGATLDFEEIGRAVGWLCDMDDQTRAAIPGIEPGRERTIHIGALILERFLQATHALQCQVSVRGWRHALLEQGLPSM